MGLWRFRSSRIRRRLTRKKPKNGSRSVSRVLLYSTEWATDAFFLSANSPPTDLDWPNKYGRARSRAQYCGVLPDGPTGRFRQRVALQARLARLHPLPRVPRLQEKYPPSPASGSEARKAPERNGRTLEASARYPWRLLLLLLLLLSSAPARGFLPR